MLSLYSITINYVLDSVLDIGYATLNYHPQIGNGASDFRISDLVHISKILK